MALAERNDPYLAFNFLVEIGGNIAGGFTEVTGLRSELEVQDYREGGVNEYIHKLAGPVRYPSNLVLKRGLADVDLLWIWYEALIRGVIVRMNVSIVLLDNAREEQRRWSFRGAYPMRWIGPELRASTAAVAVETLELVHQGLLLRV